MATEYATHLAGLNDTKPANTELVAEGDDHLRLIKNVLKTTFPGRGVTDMAPITKAIDFVPGVNEVGALYVINGATTCTMPVASGLPTGTHYWIWTPSAPLTLATSDGTLINGAVGATVPTQSGMIITYNGTGWILMRVGPGAPGADGAGVGIGLTENTWAGENTSLSVDGSSNTAYGHGALASGCEFETGNTAVGARALTSVQGAYNTAVGMGALEDATASYGLVAIGANAAKNVTSSGVALDGGVCIGFNAADAITELGSVVIIGNDAAGSCTSASGNGIALGAEAARDCVDLGYNIAIGANAMFSAYTALGCVALGSYSLTAMGYTSQPDCKFHTAIGHEALRYQRTGIGQTALGYGSLNAIGGDYCTALGYGSLPDSGTSYSTSTGLGAFSTVTGSNQVQLGSSATTTYAYGSVQNRSDARDKADVRSTSLGLAFILALRPVEFRWDYREDYAWGEKDGSKTRSRFHQGFIAQDVKKVLEDQRIDFGGFQDHSIAGGKDVLSLGYTEFIAPLVKAIQELAAEFEEYRRTHP